ncbi:MAG: arginine ABC transporter substrate-binding protein [Plesiomonas sp.]|uniref:arginine ABC transporter substrate-binding protein n=1 Tax=Plesiomonas sp. TaxID=2486279 RepID=UPI003F2C8D53
MKKLLTAALLTGSVCAGFSTSALATETIRFAMEATYPPFESTNEKNEIVGFDVDLAKALCAELKAECTFSNQAFDSLIPGLKFRRYDAAISAMDITDDRLKQVDFTKPYYDNAAIFISQKGKFADVSALKDKKVGVQNGSTHQTYINEQMKNLKAVPYGSYQNAVIDMKNGRVDAVFGDTAVIAEWLKQDKSLTPVGQPVTDKAYFGQGFGIAVNKGNTALLTQLNTALDTLHANGTYQSLYNKWFK